MQRVRSTRSPVSATRSGCKLVAVADDFLEIGLADPAGEVQVGEVDQRQAVQAGGSRGTSIARSRHVQVQALVAAASGRENDAGVRRRRGATASRSTRLRTAVRADHRRRPVQGVPPEPARRWSPRRRSQQTAR